MFAVKAKIYIDGTGDGDLCAGLEPNMKRAMKTARRGRLPCAAEANIDGIGSKTDNEGWSSLKDKIFTEDRHLSAFGVRERP